METTKKITTRNFYEGIKAVFSGEDLPEMLTANDVVEFCNKQMESLDKKAAKARELAAQKKIEGDELQAAILSVLTKEPATINEICERLNDPEISRNKVVYRLANLAKPEVGKAVKGEISVPAVDGEKKARRAVVYSLA